MIRDYKADMTYRSGLIIKGNSHGNSTDNIKNLQSAKKDVVGITGNHGLSWNGLICMLIIME